MQSNSYLPCFLAAKPKFRSPVTPNINDVTSSSATVSWPRATDLPTGLETHYHYMLWLQADGEREKNVTRVEQGAGEQRMEARITGLTFNKKYSLRVEPYRELKGEREGGASTGVVKFKTKCTGIMTNVYISVCTKLHLCPIENLWYIIVLRTNLC